MAEARKNKMDNQCSILARFAMDENGASAIEYTLILTIIGTTLVFIFDAISDATSIMWDDIDSEIDDAT